MGVASSVVWSMSSVTTESFGSRVTPSSFKIAFEKT